MANRLKMATAESILRLHAQGRSQRQIAADLQVDRKTVSRYVRWAQQTAAPGDGGSDPVGAWPPAVADSKGANAPTGAAAKKRATTTSSNQENTTSQS